ncbi:MAG: NeuD/PglB/VioB family sugar acetyltransferase [Chloroflexota bacterium]
MAKAVAIPLINTNENEALLAGLHVREGQQVAAGDLLATLETTKSTAELAAEAGGFVCGLAFEQGATVRAGDLLLYIAESADWRPPQPAAVPPAASGVQPGRQATGGETASGGAAGEAGAASHAAPLPAGLRITQPALALARRHGLDLGRLPLDRLVTESLVRAALSGAAAGQPAALASFDPSAVIVYGGGGHGKTLIDLLRLLGVYQVVGVLDDGLPPGSEVLGAPVLGGGEQLPGLASRGVRLAINAVGGIGSLTTRLRVAEKLQAAGFVSPALVHPAAVVEASARLAPGVQVFARAYVGSDARVDVGCIVNTAAVLSHDCRLGEYANISPGALLAGEVTIGAGALVGMGATVNLRVQVGAGARIGNGATVKENVPEKGVVKAGAVWP